MPGTTFILEFIHDAHFRVPGRWKVDTMGSLITGGAGAGREKGRRLAAVLGDGSILKSSTEFGNKISLRWRLY
jgi:hypothetical protein